MIGLLPIFDPPVSDYGIENMSAESNKIKAVGFLPAAFSYGLVVIKGKAIFNLSVFFDV